MVRKWARPLARAQLPEISPRAASWLEDLQANGIVKIERSHSELADYLDEQYFDKWQNGQDPGAQDGLRYVDVNNESYAENGVKVNAYISFKDEKIRSLVCDPEIGQTIYSYYGRQPHYRNQPLLQKIEYTADKVLATNGRFHTDHLRQISMMLLVRDVSENDTHMEYLLGSNRRDLHRAVYLSFEECEALAQGYTSTQCIGPKGTLFLFDASGVHRANYQAGSIRQILHLNITSGHNLKEFFDDFDDDDLDGLPPYMADFFTREGRVSSAY
jgi:hypothetical protein